MNEKIEALEQKLEGYFNYTNNVKWLKEVFVQQTNTNYRFLQKTIVNQSNKIKELEAQLAQHEKRIVDRAPREAI